MNPLAFYGRIARMLAKPPRRRYPALDRLSRTILDDYVAALRSITPERASEGVEDGRTIIQLVGHIVEWDRWTILAAGEIAAGVRAPHIMSLQGYFETNGTALEFSDLEDFNNYQAAKYSTRPWPRVLKLAVHTSTAVHALFGNAHLIAPEILEQTEPYDWAMPSGERITLPCGWYLWIAALEHKAVEHRKDLVPAISRSHAGSQGKRKNRRGKG